MKTKIQMFVMLLMLSGLSFNSQAAAKEMNKEQAQVRVMEIQNRVAEIKALDMDHMSANDRTAVKHELKDMKKELRQMEPYIYISAGALILIIVILILIL